MGSVCRDGADTAVVAVARSTFVHVALSFDRRFSPPNLPKRPHTLTQTIVKSAKQIAFSEQSRTKCIGLTIETRPDYCLKPHLSSMLVYGCTRLELGVQSIYEDVARDTNRYAFRNLKRNNETKCIVKSGVSVCCGNSMNFLLISFSWPILLCLIFPNN